MSREPGPPDGSRAVLIGVSTYQDPEFPAVRAAQNSLESMRKILTDPALCGWPPAAVTVIRDPASVTDLANRLTDLAEEASGALLVYYVGHGTLSRQGELCLTVTTTRRSRPAITGMPWDLVSQALRDSPARIRIAILDCCFAGQAIREILAGEDDATIADITHIEGVYTLTATTRNKPAHVPDPRFQDTTPTSFTGVLVELITSGIDGAPAELTLDVLYPRLRAALKARGLPQPNKRGTDTADHFIFSRNAAYGRKQSSPAAPQSQANSRPDLGSPHWHVLVTAEWALSGWTRERGHHLMECSAGLLSRQNFAEVLDRCSPGTLEDSHQITIGWLSDKKRHDFVALAIHERARSRLDEVGCASTRTRLFCAPFAELAAGSISYQALYDGFSNFPMRPDVRYPIRAKLPIAEHATPVDDLAMTAAALLLTGKPVCILGAEQLDIGKRLLFLDSVASLLPYGMRARLDAATWMSSTVQRHRFRLFFASAPRFENDDHVLIWGEGIRVPNGPGYAAEYMDWLRREPAQRRADRLSAAIEPVNFRLPEIFKLLEGMRIGLFVDATGATRAPTTASVKPPNLPSHTLQGQRPLDYAVEQLPVSIEAEHIDTVDTPSREERHEGTGRSAGMRYPTRGISVPDTGRTDQSQRGSNQRVHTNANSRLPVVSDSGIQQKSRPEAPVLTHLGDAPISHPGFSNRLMTLISEGRSLFSSFRARSSARHARPVLSIVILFVSILFSGGLLATGLAQTVEGNNKDGLGVSVTALIFVTCWLAASIFLLYKAIRKYMHR